MVDANRFRPRLEERLAALTSKLTEIDEDLKEHGTEADFEEGLGIQGQKEIGQIKAALKRIDDGIFGICVQCGEDIPEKRLELLPQRPLCTACMSASG